MSRETQKPEVREFLFEYKFQVPLSYIGKYLNHKHPELNIITIRIAQRMDIRHLTEIEREQKNAAMLCAVNCESAIIGNCCGRFILAHTHTGPEGPEKEDHQLEV
jgi:hypothetical protein